MTLIEFIDTMINEYDDGAWYEIEFPFHEIMKNAEEQGFIAWNPEQQWLGNIVPYGSNGNFDIE